MPEASPDAEKLGKEMIKAAKTGNIERIGELLRQDPALLHTRDGDDATPLHYAAWKGHREAVEALLDAGADPNAQSANDHWGGTPLHAAAHANQRAIAEMLLARGADANAVSGNGRTPLEETAIHNASSVAKLLKAHGAAH